ncbi:MAG: CapA family protein, partial [Alphaproteobacteria bacterium]|nr:CapA family protein [Alphaproteobacteria bacterium]
MARLAFVGDVMLGRLVSECLRTGLKAEQCWGDVAPLLQASDGVIANLECALTNRRAPWVRTPKVFHFRADPRAIDVLRAGNICAVCLANNHVLDFEVEGLFDSLDNLERAGIAHAGAGRNRQQAFAATRVSRGGLAIALLGVTDNEPAFGAGEHRAGTAYVDLSQPVAMLGPTPKEVDELRLAGADLIILSCHMGPNMVLAPSAEIRHYRHSLARRGIDVVHGHSAHVVQAIEQVERSIILHD